MRNEMEVYKPCYLDARALLTLLDGRLCQHLREIFVWRRKLGEEWILEAVDAVVCELALRNDALRRTAHCERLDEDVVALEREHVQDDVRPAKVKQLTPDGIQR